MVDRLARDPGRQRSGPAGAGCPGAAPRHQDRARPSWIERIGALGPLPALGIGLMLNFRPRALLLFAAASLVISGAGPGVDDVVTLIVVYTGIATSTVATPTLLAVFRPARMEPRLLVARDWIGAHGAAVTGSVMILIGVVVIGLGIGR
ncbi:MAG: GAP family protein [Microbacteriaceae bacterium]